jgi:hypothetical protein
LDAAVELSPRKDLPQAVKTKQQSNDRNNLHTRCSALWLDSLFRAC